MDAALMDDFLRDLRRDVTDNLYDQPDYIAQKADEVMVRDDIAELYEWAQVTGKNPHTRTHKQGVIEARMRVIIRRAHAKRNTIAQRIAIDYPDNPKFGRF